MTKSNDVVPLRWVIFLFGGVIAVFVGLFLVIVFIRNLPEDAIQCIQIDPFCLVSHGPGIGNSSTTAYITNVCDKSITKIVLHSTVYSTFDNTNLGEVSVPQNMILGPRQKILPILVYKDTYFDDFTYCVTDATSAYFFVK